jgi:hypothetical protein
MAENSTSDAPAAVVPLAAVGIAAPIVLERRYRLLVDALVRLHRSRRGRWSVAAGSGLAMAVLALLAARHFATSPWPLSGGEPGVLVAVCLLLLLAQGFKAWGWGRLFAADERPARSPLPPATGEPPWSVSSFRAVSTTRCASPSFAAIQAVAPACARCVFRWSCSV